MENIDSLFKMQRAHYTSAQAYDTFCDELENYLPYVFGLTKSFSELEPDVDDARKLLRSTIISAVNKIYLDCVSPTCGRSRPSGPISCRIWRNNKKRPSLSCFAKQ